MPEVDQSTLEQLQRDASAANEHKARADRAETAKAEAERVATEKERQYNSVQGNLVTVTKDKDKFKEDLALLSSNSEQTKAEKQLLEQKIKEKEDAEKALQVQLSEKDNEIEVLRLITTEFPELADWYGKGRITPNGKKGEELKTFLTGWQTDLVDTKLIEKREKGRQPPPPPPGGQISMTYSEVQDKMAEVARISGYKSKEYVELKQIEQQLFNEGKYK